jgi:hypothetical protein
VRQSPEDRRRLFKWLAVSSLVAVLCSINSGAAMATRYLTAADVSSTTPWGPTFQGLRMSLRLFRASVQAGDPVLATVDLENLGPDRSDFLNCKHQDRFEFEIARDQRQAIRKRVSVESCGSTPESSRLNHGNVVEVTFRLDDKNTLSDPGSYTLSVGFHNRNIASLVSNAVKVVIASRTAGGAYEFLADQSVPTAFEPIIAELRAHTRVPILVPIYLIDAPNTTVGEIEAVAPTSYTIQMSMGTRCHKSLYCRFGMLQGELISAASLPLTGTKVAFERGISGYYTAATCGANCDDSDLAFDYEGYRYTVGIEARRMADVVLLAQSLVRISETRATPRVARALSPVFAPIIKSLRSQTKVPLWLPAILPENDFPIYARLGEVTSKSFEIILEYDPDCRGATACQYGMLYAKLPGRDTPPGVKVRLANGLAAHFLLATCGASCGDSVLTWDIKGYRYSEELKAGPEAEMIAEANSVALF